MKIRRVFTVRVPPKAAFAFFSDPGRAFDRLASTYHVTWKGPIEPGATFELVAPNPADHCAGVVEDYEPPRHLRYRLWVKDHPERGGVVMMDFEDTGEATEVAAVVETRMSPLLELAANFLRPWLAVQANRGTRKLVRSVESDYRAASTGS